MCPNILVVGRSGTKVIHLNNLWTNDEGENKIEA